MGAAAGVDTGATQGDGLRAPHAGPQRHQQQAVVAPPDPADPVRGPGPATVPPPAGDRPT